MKLWHARFDELNDYKKMYGDCLVPYNYPPNPFLKVKETTDLWPNSDHMLCAFHLINQL
jgi:hypothetical protein